MNYSVIDNFLPQDKFLEIKQHMLGSEISWAYNSHVLLSDNTEENDLYDFQFTHTFYKRNNSTSTWINLLTPVLELLNPSAIVRIKANLIPRTEKIITHQYHLDCNHFNGKIAIFYINSNNGYTIFEDGTKIESIENRLLTFDGDILHTGTTCTDQKTRCVINFIYYNWTNTTI